MNPYIPATNDDPATIDLIDDSDAPNASNFNVAPEALANSIAYNRLRVINSNGLNWNTFTTWGVDSGSVAIAPLNYPVYNSFLNIWLMSYADSVENWYVLANSYDGKRFNIGDQFSNPAYNRALLTAGVSNQSSLGTPAYYGTVASPVDGSILRIFVDGNVGNVVTQHFDVLAGTVTQATTPSLISANTTKLSGTELVGNTWVIWYENYNASNIPFYSTNNGATWTASSITPTAGFQINQANIVNALNIILFPAEGTFGTAASKYFISSDGITWTGLAMPTLNAGEYVTGATYASFQNKYYLLTTTATVARLWQSSTALAGSWTVIYTTSYPARDLTCDGRQLVMLLEIGTCVVQSATPPTVLSSLPALRLAYSINGGLAWSLSEAGFDSLNADPRLRLQCGNGQFMFASSVGYSSSVALGPLSTFVI